MNDMKCPFCNGELVGTIGHPICRNQNCVMCDDPMPQDLLEELIRTRKALDVAVDALKDMNEIIKNYEYGNGDIESIISYLGLVKHYNSKKIVGKIFDKLGQEYRF